MPKQIEQHWHRKHFKDFEYLDVEVTPNQLMWIFILIALSLLITIRFDIPRFWENWVKIRLLE